MDFLTMSLKIERNEYTNIEQLKVRQTFFAITYPKGAENFD